VRGPRKTARPRRVWAPLALAALVATLTCTPALAFRVITYNVLNFPGSDAATRVDDFRTVLDAVNPDVLVVQEMTSQAGVTQFLNDVMNYNHPGAYAAGPFVNGPDTDNALFYKLATITYISHQEIATDLRNISEYVLRPVGYASSSAQFRVYSMHLKAGTTGDDETQRLAEATVLRNYLNALGAGTHFALGGDLNVYTSTDASYMKFLASEADNDGRSKDPINTPGSWHDNQSFAAIHTQSTRTASFGGGATGGMDDRFDHLLISYPFDDGSGLSYVTGSYTAYGNDGQHLNVAINVGTNYAVGPVIANALYQATDHIPVFADFQVPARIDAPTSLALGEAVVGGAKSLPLSVTNVAGAPADELSYSLSIPAGFTGPSGPFELAAGTSADHAISLDTSTAGAKSGNLTISSNDLDHSTWQVSLSGTVLRHARPSLAASEIVLSDELDFGSHPPDEFTDETLHVHNVGYDALQALLEVHSATIAGGDGRFSFVGGFTPKEAGQTAAEYSVAFDAAGAAPNTSYTAALSFVTRDDWSKPGAAVLDTLHVFLEAYVQSGSAVPDEDVLTLSLERSSPNPFSDRTSLVLTLPLGSEATVEMYDVAGRLVRTLVSGALPRGTQEITWDGKDETGAELSSGVYFLRAVVGDEIMARRIVLVR
jgi:endonuclease/exonuclease/phosphatase family metal-dependent hydrolase